MQMPQSNFTSAHMNRPFAPAPVPAPVFAAEVVEEITKNLDETAVVEESPAPKKKKSSKTAE